jgi:hypothetical protein
VAERVSTMEHPRARPYLGFFFCSTAPQAFFRPDRRSLGPTRAGAVKVGRHSAVSYSALSRPRLDSFEHGGILERIGPEGGPAS